MTHRPLSTVCVRLVLALSLVALAGCDALGTPPPVAAAESSEPWVEMLDAVNAARAQSRECGGESYPAAGPLAWNGRLGAAALTHTLDMQRRGEMTHQGSDGSAPGDRASRAGYSWRMVGENIARYQTDVDEVVAQWLASPSHCRQIMDARFVEMGAAERDRYWTQVFGVPR